MRKPTYLLCINDKGWPDEFLAVVKELPVNGIIYTSYKRNHTLRRMAYVIEELTNPLLPDGNEIGFHSSRFEILEANHSQNLKIPT